MLFITMKLTLLLALSKLFHAYSPKSYFYTEYENQTHANSPDTPSGQPIPPILPISSQPTSALANEKKSLLVYLHHLSRLKTSSSSTLSNLNPSPPLNSYNDHSVPTALFITDYADCPPFLAPTSGCPPGITSEGIKECMRAPRIEISRGKKEKEKKQQPLDRNVRVLDLEAMRKGWERRMEFVKVEVKSYLEMIELVSSDV
jgi:hypothetical protein